MTNLFQYTWGFLGIAGFLYIIIKMKSRYRKRTRLPYRRKRFTKRLRRGSKRNIMQKQESAGVVKKYTTVFTPAWLDQSNNVGLTVSLCGGKKP